MVAKGLGLSDEKIKMKKLVLLSIAITAPTILFYACSPSTTSITSPTENTVATSYNQTSTNYTTTSIINSSQSTTSGTYVPSSTIPIGTPILSTAQQYPISLVSLDRVTQPIINGTIIPARDWINLTLKNVSQEQVSTLRIVFADKVFILPDWRGALWPDQTFTFQTADGSGFAQGQVYPMLFTGTFGDGTAFNYTLNIIAL